MFNNLFHQSLSVVLGACACFLLPAMVCAQTIPNSADVSHIKPEEQLPRRDRSLDKTINIPIQKGMPSVPGAAKLIKLHLNSVVIVGATAFSTEELSDTTSEIVGKDITLDAVYVVANAITERYHNAGYFLSRAFLPSQEIDKGNVTIKVVEGYVGVVEGVGELSDSVIIQTSIERLIRQRPLSSMEMERFLLLLNDLPGRAFGGTLSPLEDAQDGAVKLTLTVHKTEGEGALSFDNYSSHFLGPNEVTASYSKSFLPFQQTTVSALTDVAGSKLRYGTMDHSISLMPDVKLDLSGGITQALPGYTLESSEIESVSTFASVSLDYQWVRQRQQNLSIKGTLDARNVTSDILGSPLTRDTIRAFRTTVNVDVTDDWQGTNNAHFIFSQGMNWLSSSHAGDMDLSRAGALPDFTKAECSLSRVQVLGHDWSAVVSGAGQWASGVLYSSEQFGYGGQSFGRAYDASDYTGDRGIKGAVEVRYDGLANGNMFRFQPYGFYDIGKVWNDAIGQNPQESASSFGIGARFSTQWKQSGNVGLAWPIDKDITTPIYGASSAHGPRIMLQISQQF